MSLWPNHARKTSTTAVGICETASCPVRELAYRRVVQLPPTAVRDSRLRARCTAQRRGCSNSGNYCDIAFTDERRQDIQWRTQDFILGGTNLPKFDPDMAYNISKKNVAMQV